MRSWIRNHLPFWVACLAFLYPLYWTATFALHAVPALVRVALFDHQLAYLRLSHRGISAASFPPLVGAFKPSLSQAERDPLVVSLPLIVVIAAGLALVPGRYRHWSGLVLAVLGNVGALSWLVRMMFRGRATPEAVIAVVCFFVILILGLRWVVNRQAGSSYAVRATAVFAFVALPAGLIVALFNRSFLTALLPFHLIPGLLATIFVSLRPSAVRWDLPHLHGWRPAAVGVAFTLLFLTATLWGQRVLRSDSGRQTEDLQSILAGLPADEAFPRIFFQKGVNFTAEWPDTYSSFEAVRMLESLPDYGVNAVALVPYGFTPRGSPSVRFGNGWERDEGLARLSVAAHRLGIKVMLKPQIWVRPGFPGDLEFSSSEDRQNWFGDYRLFLEHYARLAKQIHADLLCVGVEFSKLVQYEDEWRKLIAHARELYPGPLVYAANAGVEFESIRFWDDLDYIGLDNYYPLPDDLSTADVVAKVEAVQRRFKRPVLFTEAGFSSFEAPHRKPWDEPGGEIALAAQAACYEAIFRAFYHKPWFQGVYWWKVGSNGYGGPQDGSHTPWGKPAMEVIGEWYRNHRDDLRLEKEAELGSSAGVVESQQSERSR